LNKHYCCERLVAFVLEERDATRALPRELTSNVLKIANPSPAAIAQRQMIDAYPSYWISKFRGKLTADNPVGGYCKA
jgi:hypothetical protein